MVRALDAEGYQQAVAGFFPDSGRIRLRVAVPTGADRPDESHLLDTVRRYAATPARATKASLSGRAVEFYADDINIRVVEHDGPIVEPQHSRGGNWLSNNGTLLYTSAFSVSGPNGDGIVTAG